MLPLPPAPSHGVSAPVMANPDVRCVAVKVVVAGVGRKVVVTVDAIGSGCGNSGVVGASGNNC